MASHQTQRPRPDNQTKQIATWDYLLGRLNLLGKVDVITTDNNVTLMMDFESSTKLARYIQAADEDVQNGDWEGYNS